MKPTTGMPIQQQPEDQQQTLGNIPQDPQVDSSAQNMLNSPSDESTAAVLMPKGGRI